MKEFYKYAFYILLVLLVILTLAVVYNAGEQRGKKSVEINQSANHQLATPNMVV